MSVTAEVALAEPVAVKRGGALRQRLQQFMAAIGLVVIFAVFSIMAPGTFATWESISNILLSATLVGCLGMGATFVIVTAGIDLSAGTGMALTAVMAGMFLTHWGFPTVWGILATLVCGMIFGSLNGLMITRLGLPPFISTLAMMWIAEGLTLVIPNMNPLVLDSARYPDMYALANGTLIPGLPNAVLVLVVAVIVAFIIFNKTIFGRYDISIGSNSEATALSGVNVKKWLIIIYAAAGMFTALAGVLYIARFSGITSATTGVGFEMQAIAATVIGGTSLSGGKGSIIGTLIGALVMATINYGLLVTGVPQQWQNVILGLVIVIVVFIDQARVRRANAH